MNFVEALIAAQAGYDTWAAKPHNKKWAKMVYHTPIPNDLSVCIAEAVCAATRADDLEEQKNAFEREMETLALRAALQDMRARDDVNGSLPVWYRERIDAALAAAPEGKGGAE